LSFSAGFGAFSSLYASYEGGSGDYVDQHSTDRYHSPYNYGYLHPDSSTNPATMKIYLLSMKNTIQITSSSSST